MQISKSQDIHDMAELSLEGLFGIGEAIGIIATLFVILYFFKKANAESLGRHPDKGS